jgi:hypothetical protein
MSTGMAPTDGEPAFRGARVIVARLTPAHLDEAILAASWVVQAGDVPSARGEMATQQTPPARTGGRLHNRDAGGAT